MPDLIVSAPDGRRLPLEEFKAHYESAMKNPSRLSRRYRATLDLICRETAGSTGRWLDYGSGWGDFAWHLARRLERWSIVGLDGDETCHGIATALFSAPNLAFQYTPYGDFAALPDATWDGLGLLEVLEHVTDARTLLGQCRRVLRPGGLLVLSTPNAFGWRYVRHELGRRANKLLGRRGDEGYLRLLKDLPYDPVTERGHVSTYTAEVLERLLRVAGFEVGSMAFVPIDGSLAGRLFPDTLLIAARRREDDAP